MLSVRPWEVQLVVMGMRHAGIDQPEPHTWSNEYPGGLSDFPREWERRCCILHGRTHTRWSDRADHYRNL